MKKILFAIVFLGLTSMLQFCGPSKKAVVVAPPLVTYENSVKQVIVANCTPCHIAGKGNKISLDNYEQAHGTADDIIARIQKNPDERGFMPAMHPKLSDSTIHVFIEWKQSGLLER